MASTKIRNKTSTKLSSHKFNTSGYVVMKSGTRRNATTGRLISENKQKKSKVCS